MGFSREGFEVAAILFQNKNGLTIDDLLQKSREIMHVYNSRKIEEYREMGNKGYLWLKDEYGLHLSVFSALFGRRYDVVTIEKDIKKLYASFDFNLQEEKIHLRERSYYFWKMHDSKYFFDEEKTFKNCPFSLSEDLEDYKNGLKKSISECGYGFCDLLMESLLIKTKNYKLLFKNKITEFVDFYNNNPDIVLEYQKAAIEWLKKYKPENIPQDNDERTRANPIRRVMDAEFIFRIADKNVNYGSQQ